MSASAYLVKEFSTTTLFDALAREATAWGAHRHPESLGEEQEVEREEEEAAFSIRPCRVQRF